MSQTQKDVLILVSRIIIGGIFIAAGWMKVSAIAMTIGYFAKIGIPASLAYAVGYLELIGGIMVVLGLWSYLAKGVLSIIMLFAIYYTFPMGLQGYMAPLAVLGGLLALGAAGDGKFVVLKNKMGMGMGMGAGM